MTPHNKQEMNKKGNAEWIIFLVIIFLLGIMLIIFFMFKSVNQSFQSYEFCTKQGYDINSLGGSYSEKYGMVECVSCYKEDCEYKEFRVKEDIFGRLIKK